MRIKATIVAYAFSVWCFENTTIVTYVGLRVKLNVYNTVASKHSNAPKCHLRSSSYFSKIFWRSIPQTPSIGKLCTLIVLSTVTTV